MANPSLPAHLRRQASERRAEDRIGWIDGVMNRLRSALAASPDPVVEPPSEGDQSFRLLGEIVGGAQERLPETPLEERGKLHAGRVGASLEFSPECLLTNSVDSPGSEKHSQLDSQLLQHADAASEDQGYGLHHSHPKSPRALVGHTESGEQSVELGDPKHTMTQNDVSMEVESAHLWSTDYGSGNERFDEVDDELDIALDEYDDEILEADDTDGTINESPRDSESRERLTEIEAVDPPEPIDICEIGSEDIGGEDIGFENVGAEDIEITDIGTDDLVPLSIQLTPDVPGGDGGCGLVNSDLEEFVAVDGEPSPHYFAKAAEELGRHLANSPAPVVHTSSDANAVGDTRAVGDSADVCDTVHVEQLPNADSSMPESEKADVLPVVPSSKDTTSARESPFEAPNISLVKFSFGPASHSDSNTSIPARPTRHDDLLRDDSHNFGTSSGSLSGTLQDRTELDDDDDCHSYHHTTKVSGNQGGSKSSSQDSGVQYEYEGLWNLFNVGFSVGPSLNLEDNETREDTSLEEMPHCGVNLSDDSLSQVVHQAQMVFSASPLFGGRNIKARRNDATIEPDLSMCERVLGLMSHAPLFGGSMPLPPTSDSPKRKKTGKGSLPSKKGHFQVETTAPAETPETFTEAAGKGLKRKSVASNNGKKKRPRRQATNNEAKVKVPEQQRRLRNGKRLPDI